MEYSLLKAWNVRVPEQSSKPRLAVDGRRSEGFLILHPRQGPPKTAMPVWKQSCRPRCSLTPTSPNKQVDFETITSKIGTGQPRDLSHSRRPTLRNPGTCKRYDSMRGILEHDICQSTTLYHGLRHAKPNSNIDLGNSRDQLRHVREGASGDKTLHLAERLVVCDTDVAMKRQPSARPPWPKEFVAQYLTESGPLVASCANANDTNEAKNDERQRTFDAHCLNVSAWDNPRQVDCTAAVSEAPRVAVKRMGCSNPAQSNAHTRLSPPPLKGKQQFQSQVNSWKAALGGQSEEALAAMSEEASLFKTQQILLRSQRAADGSIVGKRMLSSTNQRGLSPVTWRRTLPRQMKPTTATAVMGVARG
ncbi:hypothetical protein, variant 1 [Aphanomyces astaci]|uniref:Uncharacterized protein n=1 Tax=Aphanomyces astaci TaxID=112090 RepID=W4H8M3_APHAT|nr:hypothetical protein, variant 1 [Aphanomyces astaci]ETV87911.1 hypothetical protein, variant 1 [Aphanomyces astaci]|eukprot:XP_009822774.1 hypothetical protein, variant 1 [Aphanomyces astaci]